MVTPTLSDGPVTIRPIRIRDARALERELRATTAAGCASGRRPTRTGRSASTCEASIRSLSGERPQRVAACRSSSSTTASSPGQLNVSSIAYGSLSSATIGYWVAERFAGHGVTPTAVALATDHCFFTPGAAPHGDLHPPRERAEPARRREARLPLRGPASSLHPHQRRLARPLLLRAHRRGGAAGRAAALEGRPRARERGPHPRGRPAGGHRTSFGSAERVRARPGRHPLLPWAAWTSRVRARRSWSRSQPCCGSSTWCPPGSGGASIWRRSATRPVCSARSG